MNEEQISAFALAGLIWAVVVVVLAVVIQHIHFGGKDEGDDR